MKSAHSWIRRSQRVIRVVSELHRMGYQRLRIMPYEYPLAWRLMVAPDVVFSKANGAFIRERLRKDQQGRFFPTYSSASEDQYFDWPDCAGNDARTLAEKFVSRFSGVAESGKGRDWTYAGWLTELVGYLEGRDVLPFLFSEFFVDPPETMRGLPMRVFRDHAIRLEDFPLPPPGRADDTAPPQEVGE